MMKFSSVVPVHSDLLYLHRKFEEVWPMLWEYVGGNAWLEVGTIFPSCDDDKNTSGVYLLGSEV